MLGRGRPVHDKDLRKIQYSIDSALALWPADRLEISPRDLSDSFFRNGLITSKLQRYQIIRILNQCIKAGHVEKVAPGRYRLKSKPDEFKLFDLLSNLREQARRDNLVFTGRVGGSLWTANETCYLGMPEDVTEVKDAWALMSILELRLSRIFLCYQGLANLLQRRRETQSNIPLPSQFLREVLAELLPWWLESKIGPDGDGLYITDLVNINEKIITSLPETVESEGWVSDTQKELLLDSFKTIKKIIENREKYDDEQRNINRDYDYEEETNELKRHFAMIITEPEFNLDENTFENRQVYDIMKDSIKEKTDNLEFVTDVILYDYNTVKNNLKKYGTNTWGYKRSKEILELYEKVYLSNLISRWFGSFPKGVTTEICNAVNSFIEKGNKPKDIVYYLAFSHGSINFIQPTEEKKKIIYQLFPDIPHEKIDEWYLAGVDEAQNRAEATIDKLSHYFKDE